MKILHILEATQGGTRRHILDLLPVLQRRGIDCDLLYSCERNPGFATDALWLGRRGLGTYLCPMTRAWGGARDAAALRLLCKHLRAHRYDLIHCHSTKAGLLGRLANALQPAHPPLVYTPHCIAFDTGLPRPQRRLARALETLLAPFTARYIAVSLREQRIILAARLCATANVTHIPNGIDLECFDGATGEAAQVRNNAFTIGCFGRLSRQKNQDLLVRSLPALQRHAPTARLLLVGGGEGEARLRAQAARLGIQDAVSFTGEVDEARPFYSVCDVVAQPSRWEGCPYSVLEAMAAGRPVVATPVGGVPELLGHGAGVLCQPAAFVEQLTGLAAAQDQRRNLGAIARARVAAEFTLDAMVRRTIGVYEASC